MKDGAEAIIQSHPSLETMTDCVNAIVLTALDRKRAILHIYNSTSRDVYEQYLWDVCGHVVRIYLSTVLNGRHMPEDDWKIIHRHYTCMVFGCVCWWLASGMKDDVLPDLHRIVELQKDSLEQIITRSLSGIK